MAFPQNPPSNPGAKKPAEEYYWLWVLCVLGLDYFSTLAYQPSITFHETKRLGPLATAAVVLVTLFGALPVYCYLAGRSPGGQGSLGVVEKLIRGWRGKTIVLILLGFAATDFTMLKSLSLADASVHVISTQDGYRHETTQQCVAWVKGCASECLGEEAADYCNEQLIVTILLGIIGTFFWFALRKGFNRNVMILAVPLVGLYLLMSGILLGGGVWLLYQHPDLVTTWLDQVQGGDLLMPTVAVDAEGWSKVALLSLLALPNLALGLSGFELSMILMPQVQGKTGEQPPRARIRNTRKVLILAALTMSVYLLAAVFVTTLLIPPEHFAPRGHANDRALAYLAHGGKLTLGDEPLLPFCGTVFGTLYDLVTVLILCLAGTSVMTALSVLLPQFLLRFGMEFRWSQKWGVLLISFAAINTLLAVWFQAKVEEQRGAYATGVLVLIACAAVVTVFDKRRVHEHPPVKRGWDLLYYLDMAFYGLIALVFVTTMLAVAMKSGSGLGISLCFIAAILAMSIVSRAYRADELRTIGFEFKDEQSKYLWDNLRLNDFPLLVPMRPGKMSHETREKQLREDHQLSAEVDFVFLEICIDDPSDFFQHLLIEVLREHNRFVIKVTNGVSLAHAIAAVALEMSRHSRPPNLHFDWPSMDMLSASWSYLAFGEGNIPWKVRELIYRAEKDAAKRPRVVVG